MGGEGGAVEVKEDGAAWRLASARRRERGGGERGGVAPTLAVAVTTSRSPLATLPLPASLSAPIASAVTSATEAASKAAVRSTTSEFWSALEGVAGATTL